MSAKTPNTAAESGASFAVPQYLVSNFHGPWLVDVVAAISSMVCLAGFLRVWHPKTPWLATSRTEDPFADDSPVPGPRSVGAAAAPREDSGKVFRAWLPWIILSVFVFLVSEKRIVVQCIRCRLNKFIR